MNDYYIDVTIKPLPDVEIAFKKMHAARRPVGIFKAFTNSAK